MNPSKLSSYVATLALLFGVGHAPQVQAQPTVSLGMHAMGMGLHWLGLTAEVNVFRPDTVGLLRSLNIAVGFGAPMRNASYVPVEARAVLFSGSSHVEASVGVSIQVLYRDTSFKSTFVHLSSAPLVPGALVGYRFEPDSGGLLLRFGLGVMYHYNDKLVTPIGVSTIGFSF